MIKEFCNLNKKVHYQKVWVVGHLDPNCRLPKWIEGHWEKEETEESKHDINDINEAHGRVS